MPSRALAELFFHFWIQIANREHAHSESPLNDNLTHVHSLHALRHRMVLRPTILTGHTLTSDRGGMLGAYLAFETDWQPHDHKRKPQYRLGCEPRTRPAWDDQRRRGHHRHCGVLGRHRSSGWASGGNAARHRDSGNRVHLLAGTPPCSDAG